MFYHTQVLTWVLKRPILTSVWHFGLIIAVIVFIASLGVNGTTLVFIIIGLSVGVGFALQDLMKNFFAGFMLLVEIPIKVGNWVDLNGNLCEVKKVKLRSTVVQDFDLNIDIIPNNLFMSQVVCNETINPICRMNMKVTIDLLKEIKTVPQILKDIAQEQTGFLNHPENYVTFEGYGEYTYNFILRAFCYRRVKLATETELRIAIVERLIKLGFNIPLNTTQVILKNG